MNNYTYEELEIGMMASYEIQIKEEYLDAFRKNTYDTNPLHFDDAVAKQKGYDKHVVFGMLTATYYSTLAGVYLPGERSLIHSIEVKFMKPVYVEDKLVIEGTVTEKNDLFRYLIIKATIINQYQEKVSKAVMKVGVI